MTTVDWPSLSIGIANPDFAGARQTFAAEPNAFSPVLSMRAWINPASEPDVKFVARESIPDEEPEAETVSG
ncbi:hypothetical protein HDA40_000701 [Hamadaea flava]|uniref:Uncharacterized protein n=1 Tax=Hamadaea flava TaxID=1742688 RepID=A0ABV8LYM4_9ACTN|nr:hypothetical protein [Hamadaea flava]MCP2322194.1 hypothetical protein [Hamadaea flava]